MSASPAVHQVILRLAVHLYVLVTLTAVGVLVVDQAVVGYALQFRLVGLVLVLGLAVLAIGVRAIGGRMARGRGDGSGSQGAAGTWLAAGVLAVGCVALGALVVALVDRMAGGVSLLG